MEKRAAEFWEVRELAEKSFSIFNGSLSLILKQAQSAFRALWSFSKDGEINKK